MSRVRTKEGKRTFYRDTYVQMRSAPQGVVRHYFTGKGKLALDPSQALFGPFGEQPKAELESMGLNKYKMPILLTGKSDRGVPSIRKDIRYFVMLCLGYHSYKGSDPVLMYYTPSGAVPDVERATIFSSHEDAYAVGRMIYPNSAAVQAGRNFPYGSVSFVGVSLDNFSGMQFDASLGVWKGIPNTKR